MSAQKPVQEIRLGLIKAAVWHNLTRAWERYNVTLTRLYRNGDLWKESTHFGRDDLLLASNNVRWRFNDVEQWISKGCPSPLP